VLLNENVAPSHDEYRPFNMGSDASDKITRRGCVMPTVSHRTEPNISRLRAFTVRPGAANTSYLAGVTDFTEMVSPSAVPVTLACSQCQLAQFVQRGFIRCLDL
jgi:hypothetical protein